VTPASAVYRNRQDYPTGGSQSIREEARSASSAERRAEPPPDAIPAARSRSIPYDLRSLSALLDDDLLLNFAIGEADENVLVFERLVKQALGDAATPDAPASAPANPAAPPKTDSTKGNGEGAAGDTDGADARTPSEANPAGSALLAPARVDAALSIGLVSLLPIQLLGRRLRRSGTAQRPCLSKLTGEYLR
jgi:hypothetical protein